MSRHPMEKYLENASVTWSSFLDVKPSEAGVDTDLSLAESVDDLLIRYDEFEQLLDMVHSDTEMWSVATLPKLKASYEAIQKTFEKVDRLETMVARIKSDVDKSEKQMIEAESTSNIFEHSLPLRAFIRPNMIFGRHSVEASNPTVPSSSHAANVVDTYEPLQIFSTEEFFKK